MYNYSVSLIVPKASRADANKLACALGHDDLPGNTFSTELTNDGTTITHYGAHTYAEQSFVDILTNAKQGTLPAVDWADYGLTAAKVNAVLSAMTAVAKIGTVDDTWPDAMQQAGVNVLTPELP